MGHFKREIGANQTGQNRFLTFKGKIFFYSQELFYKITLESFGETPNRERNCYRAEGRNLSVLFLD